MEDKYKNRNIIFDKFKMEAEYIFIFIESEIDLSNISRDHCQDIISQISWVFNELIIKDHKLMLKFKLFAFFYNIQINSFI
jgi:hypothetical protein